MKREGARRPLAGRSVAFKVAIVYAFVGGLWILLSDNLAAVLAPDLDSLVRLQMYKGWFFIAASAALLYLLIHRQLRPVVRFQEHLRESEAKYQRILDSAQDAIVLFDLEAGTIVDLNARAAELLARPVPRMIDKPLNTLFPPGEGDHYQHLLGELAAGRSLTEQMELYDEQARRGRPVEVTASTFEMGDRRMMQGTFREITEPEQEGRRALEEMDELKEETRKARFLSEAASVLFSTLEHEATLHNVVHAAIPALGDWCVLDVVEEDGSVRRSAAAHRDPAMEEAVAGLLDYSPDPQHPQQVLQAIRNEEPVLQQEVTEEWMKALAHDSEEQRLLRELSAVSLLTVPLIAHGRAVGALTLAAQQPDRAFDDADLELASAFARLGAQAVENAQRQRAAREGARRDTDFIGTMARDLRGPLNDLVSYANLIERDLADDAAPSLRQEIERIRERAQAIVRLSTEAQIYAAREAGGEPDLERLDLAEIAREAAALVEPAAADRAVRLRLDAPAEPLHARTDASRLREIIVDLLSRGVQTSRGELALRLERADGAAVFEIGGPGDEDEQGSPPDGQQAADGADAPPSGRTAEPELGSTRKLADLLGATLHVGNSRTGSSLFILRLPLDSPQDASAARSGSPG